MKYILKCFPPKWQQDGHPDGVAIPEQRREKALRCCSKSKSGVG